MVARVEREKQLQLENSSIRLQAAELEAANLREEVTRQRIRIEKLETERKQLTDQIMDLRNEIIANKESENDFKDQERRLNQERDAQSVLIGKNFFVSKSKEIIKIEGVVNPLYIIKSKESLKKIVFYIFNIKYNTLIFLPNFL